MEARRHIKPKVRHISERVSGRQRRRENHTRSQIIDVAEGLFAEYGFAGVSLRTIVMKAGVNLAAIHYHFGTKEALFQTIFERRARPLANERMRRLRELQTDGTPSLEAVLEAFLAPSLLYATGVNSGGQTFARLRARLIAENSALARRLQAEYFNESSRGFLTVLAKILPELPIEDLYWRFNFLLGSMVYMMADVKRIDELSDGSCDTSDVEEGLERLVAFLCWRFSIAAFNPCLPQKSAQFQAASGLTALRQALINCLARWSLRLRRYRPAVFDAILYCWDGDRKSVQTILAEATVTNELEHKWRPVNRPS